MTIEDIMKARQELDMRLRIAASTMTLTEDIKKIRRQIEEVQSECPHFSEKYNYALDDGRCPYCGKKIK